MISSAITLVRLRWTLTLATLRKSAWQTVAYVFSAVLAAGTIIGTGVLAWFIGILPPFTVNADGFPLNILGSGGIVNIVVVLVGAAFQLPFDALTGAWAVLLARIAILAVTWIVCFAVCTWCLRHERLTIGANSPSETAKGIGAFAWMPDSASGAVSARLITYLKRDPRQAMTFAMPVLFLIIFAFQAHGISAVVWQSLIWCGWFMSVVESNGLAYDGRGFTMEVIAGVRGRTDRIGRVRVYVGIMVVYMVLLYLAGIVLVGALAGRWAQPDDLATGLIFLATGMGIALSGLGVAEVTSCVLMYPVASMDKPFSAPQGRAMAQGFFPFVYMLGSLLLMLPTGIVALVMLLTGAEGVMWLAIIPVALANGIGILALGTWLGGKLMDARMLSIVATLDSFASLQK